MTQRNYTPASIRRQVEEQGHLCLYCLLPFGTLTRHRGHNSMQRTVGDHFVPFAYTGTTTRGNLVAACQVCNTVKNARMFEDVNHAQRWILSTRENRGYRVLFVPRTAITDEPWVWGQEYARWLIDG